MKGLLSAFFVLLCLTALAQETKKVKEKNKQQGYIEEYDVLKSDPDIRHGNYTKTSLSGGVLVEGFYSNDEKDSLWTEYYRESNLLKSVGSYQNGERNGVWTEYFSNGSKVAPAYKGVYFDDERVGVWKFYSSDTSLAQKYNYSERKLNYFSKTCTEFIDQMCEVQTREGVNTIKLDQPPMYLGGHSKLMDDLFTIGVKYPHNAMKSGIDGTVIISFFIDENGNTFGYQVEQGIGGGCDNEALSAVSRLPSHWLPGMLNGEKVVAKYLVSVKFAII